MMDIRHKNYRIRRLGQRFLLFHLRHDEIFGLLHFVENLLSVLQRDVLIFGILLLPLDSPVSDWLLIAARR